ncbi:MAG TPA: phasin family protein [Stellaceae bacterium]|nr:phasin family protein [Stellaceae bacterium]
MAAPAAAASELPVPETAAVALETANLPAPTPMPPTATTPSASAAAAGRLAAAAADDGWTVLAEAQAALARACEEMTVEVGGMTRSGIAAGTDAALALLGARTFAEAVEINAGLARRGFDTIIGGSAKLSEIGVKAMTEASRPILTRLSASWSAASRG